MWLKVWLVIATRSHSKYKSGGALCPGDNEFKFDFGHISGKDLQTIENIALGLRRLWLESKCQGSVSRAVESRVPLTSPRVYRQEGDSQEQNPAAALVSGWLGSSAKATQMDHARSRKDGSRMAKEAKRDSETPCHRLQDEWIFAHWPFCSCD